MTKPSYDSLIGYATLDGFKRKAIEAARKTFGSNLQMFGYRPVEASYGESVFLIEHDTHYMAFVLEGLGTKNLVAERVHLLKALGGGNPRGFANFAQDTVAMIVNDLAVVDAHPLVVGSHIAVGNADLWFKDAECNEAFVEGWKKSCDEVGAKWGGGETAALPSVIYPETAVLSGGSFGIISPKADYICGDVEEGDQIFFAVGSGIHANGLTQARGIAASLPRGYLTELDDGKTFGEHLLEPTPLLPPLIAHLVERGAKPHYVVGMTGHGYRKLMRLPKNFSYVVEELPHPQKIFPFIQRESKSSERDMYGTHNMGAVAALMFPPAAAKMAPEIAASLGWELRYGGYVEKSDRRRVILEPNDVVFEGDELDIR